MTTTNKKTGGQGKDAAATVAKAAHLEKSGKAATREEAQLDRAVENTFPASDPIAELPAAATSTKVIDSEDALLDEGIEETFPASDPVAAGNITKIIPQEHVTPEKSGKTGPASRKP